MLQNDVKDKQGKYEGVYTFQGFSKGSKMDYYVDAEREYAIWYNAVKASWFIGYLSHIRSEDEAYTFAHTYTPDTNEITGLCFMKLKMLQNYGI